MYDSNLRFCLLIADITPIIKRIHTYPTLLSILPQLPLQEVIEALLSVSVNHKPGKLLETNREYLQTIRDDNELIWHLLEQNLGEKFETIEINSLDAELDSLLCELDGTIGRILPQGWGPGEYTFFKWIGPGQLVVLKDL